MLNLCIATLAVEQLENCCNFLKLLFFAKILGNLFFQKTKKRRYMGRRTRAPCGGPAVGHWWCFHQGAPSVTNEWIHVGAMDLDGTTADHGSAPSGPGRCEDGEKKTWKVLRLMDVVEEVVDLVEVWIFLKVTSMRVDEFKIEV